MPVRSKVGTFLSGTGGAGSTVVISGLGFTPKAIIFWSSGKTSSGVEANSIAHCTGFACTGIDNQCVAGSCMNAAATPTCDNWFNLNKCIMRLNSDGTDGGNASVTTLGSDGFTLTIGTAFAVSTYYNYLAIGGEDIESVDCNNFTIPASATTKAITSPGFRPDVLFFISASEPATGANTDMSFAFGVSTRKQNAHGGIAMKDIDAVAVTDSAYYQRNGESLVGFTGTNALTIRGAVQSFDSLGFTVNMTESNIAAAFSYLAIKGGNWHLGNTTAPADTSTTKTVSGFGFHPRAMLFFAAEAGENASDTPGTDGPFTMGAIDANGNYFGSQWETYDGQADGSCTRSYLTDAVLADANSTPAFEWKATIPTTGPNGFKELNSVYSLGSAPFFFYLAIGDTNPNGIYTDMWV